MNRFTPSIIRSFALAFAFAGGLAACSAASAQSAPTTNVLELACPGATLALTDSLAALARDRTGGAEVNVNLSLSAQGIDAVQTSGASSAHRQAVGRALRDLDCQGSVNTNQSLSLRIQFAKLNGLTPASSTRTAGEVSSTVAIRSTPR